MTNEQFDQLVNRIQSKYGSRPLALRLRVALFVILGYSGFLAVLLLVLLLATALTIAAFLTGQGPGIILIGIVAGLLAFGIWQAMVVLWVHMAPDEGREVTRTDAPRLFQLLDRLQSDFETRRFDHVQMTSELNACVQMVPRLGIFGWNRSYLVIGLPLMQALTPEQFAAVLAHEFAHSSSRHDRFGTWIYRIRQTWDRIFTQLQNAQTSGVSQWHRSAIVWFIRWYWPRLNAYAFVLSRADEYRADKMSAEWAGVETAGEALFLLECLGIRLADKFWSELTRMAKIDESVPDDFCERLQAFFDSEPDPADAARWLKQSTSALTGCVDTHPSLSDRLNAIGFDVDQFLNRPFPRLPRRSAAELFLEDAEAEIAHDLNLKWQKDNTLRWQNLFHQNRRAEKVLAPVLKSSLPPDPAVAVEASRVDVEQLWKRASAVCNLQGTAEAEPLLRELLTSHPSHPLAAVTLGRHLLEQGQSEGEDYLRPIIEEEDNELIPAACEALVKYFQQSGQVERVQQTQAQWSKFEVAQTAAAKERSTVTVGDRFVPHELDEQELSVVTNRLAEEADLAAAWLVRKDLRHFPRQRLFVLVVQSEPKGFFGSSNPNVDRAIVTRLITSLKLPGRSLIIAPQEGFRRLARKISSMPDARIFPPA